MKCTLRRGLENSEITLTEELLQAQTKVINIIAKNWLHTDTVLKQSELCTERSLWNKQMDPAAEGNLKVTFSKLKNAIKSINVSAPVYR